MSIDFSSVFNHNEQAVFHAVAELAPKHPEIAQRHELLRDVACVALNRLPPRYMQHAVDFAFYQGQDEREAHQTALQDAVTQAFAFVTERSQIK